MTDPEAENDGTSLDTQLAACRAYATEHGYAVDDRHIYREVHVGTELWERPALTALREMARHGELDVIVAFSIDRLARDAVHLGVIISEADHANVRVEFATETMDGSPEGQLVQYIRGYAGKVESERIKERVARGKAARIAAGKLPSTGWPAFGYDWADPEKTRYRIAPEQADLVRRIFTLMLQGSTLRGIAQTLHQEGIPTPRHGRGWEGASIRQILVNPAYRGMAVLRRSRSQPSSEWYVLPEGTIPPIIDEETFNAVAERLRQNKAEASRHNPYPEATLLRTGYARCGECGRNMAVHNHVEDRYPQYVCGGRDCRDRVAIASHILDDDAWHRITETAAHPELIAAKLQDLQQQDPSADDLSAIDRQLADVKRKQANGTRALLDLDDESAGLLKEQLALLAERRRHLEEDRVTVEARRRGWEEAQVRLQDIELWCRVAARNLEHADYARKRQALIVFDLQATVYKAESTPRYVITMKPMIEPSIVETPMCGTSQASTTGACLSE